MALLEGEPAASRVPGTPRGSSGQVLVEACLALALLVFAWITAGFAVYMSTNHIRTAMAARHAAWLECNGGTADAKDIATNFFMLDEDEAGIVKVDPQDAKGSIGEFLSGSDYGLRSKDLGKWVEVTYGITAEQLASTEVFPFSLMRTEVPLMPPSVIENLLSVKSHCQWADVGETWTDRKKALQGVWNTLVSELSAVWKVVSKFFSNIL